jgi:VCBS repeat-containing protein
MNKVPLGISMVPVLEQLEPRILLSGSPVTNDSNDTPVVNTTVDAAETQAPEQTIHEIMFIDANVENYQELLSGLNANVEVFLIDAEEDGMERISSELKDMTGISALHIVSHGDSGEVSLGSTVLTTDNLMDYSAQLMQWGDALTVDADILIYGCDVGQDSQFVEDLSSLTDADVAASDDITGADWLGGDAELEVTVGDIETATALTQESMNEAGVLLAVPTTESKAVTIVQNVQYAFTEADFAFSDVDGDSFQGIEITTLPLEGTLSLDGDSVVVDQLITAAEISTLVFTPGSDEFGLSYASFEFIVVDSANEESSPETFTFDVINVRASALFWTTANENDISAQSFEDNLQVELLLQFASNLKIDALAFNSFTNTMYWADPVTDSISYISLDSLPDDPNDLSGVKVLYAPAGSSSISSMTLDIRSEADDGWLYFSDGGDLMAIDFSQYDGTTPLNEGDPGVIVLESLGGGESINDVIVDFYGSVSSENLKLYYSTSKGDLTLVDIEYNDSSRDSITNTTITTLIDFNQGNFSGLVLDFAEDTDKRIYWLDIQNNNVFFIDVADFDYNTPLTEDNINGSPDDGGATPDVIGKVFTTGLDSSSTVTDISFDAISNTLYITDAKDIITPGSKGAIYKVDVNGLLPSGGDFETTAEVFVYDIEKPTDLGLFYVALDAPEATDDDYVTDENTNLSVLAGSGDGLLDVQPDLTEIEQIMVKDSEGALIAIEPTIGEPADTFDLTPYLSYILEGEQALIAGLNYSGGASLTVNVDGSFDLVVGTMFDSLPDGESLEILFSYRQLVGFGFVGADVNIIVNGVDDASEITGDVGGSVTEGDIGDSPETDSGTLLISDIDDNPFFPDVVSSAGDNGYGNFEMSSGTWMYTLDQSAVQALDQDEEVFDTFTFIASDGNSQEVSITITGTNDASEITGDVGGSVTEGNVGDSPETDSGTLLISDIDGDDNPFFPDVVSSGGDNGYGNFEMSSGTWTYTLDQSAVQELDQDDEVFDTFTFIASDGNSQEVTITITGTDDASVVSGVFTGVVSEGDVDDPLPTTATGNLSISDIDGDDNPSFSDVGSTAGDNSYGHFVLVDGAWTYTLDQSMVQDLDAGDEVSDTITYTATDGTEQLITVTILGTDDTSVVSGTFVGDVSEGDVGDSPETTSGTLSISDIDGDDNPSFSDVGATVGDNSYGSFVLVDGAWTYTLDQSMVQDLDAGDEVSDTITYTATDGTEQLITVMILGTNDAPVLTVNNIDVTVGDLLAGEVSFTDVDLGDTPLVTLGDTLDVSWLDGDAVILTLTDIQTSTLGDRDDLSISNNSTVNNGSETWSDILSSEALQFLGEGESLVLTFNVTVDDGNGGSDTKEVALTITGVNDGPQITGVTGPDSVDEGTEFDLGITFNDPDAIDNDHSITVNWGDGTTTTSAADLAGGTYSYPHNYANDGEYTITITVTDEFGVSDTISLSILIGDTLFVEGNEVVNNAFSMSTEGVDILPPAEQVIVQGNSLAFLSGNSDLQFEQENLAQDALAIVADLFSGSTSIETEVADFESGGDALVNATAFEESQLTDEEMSFLDGLEVNAVENEPVIEDLEGTPEINILNDVEVEDSEKEPESDEELDEELEENDEASFFEADSEVLHELSAKEIAEDKLTQKDLDKQVSLDDTLMGEFDSLSA